MTKIPEARVFAFSVSVDCPSCGESIAEPSSGSLVWEVNQIRGTGEIASCPACGTAVLVRLPKRLPLDSKRS